MALDFENFDSRKIEGALPSPDPMPAAPTSAAPADANAAANASSDANAAAAASTENAAGDKNDGENPLIKPEGTAQPAAPAKDAKAAKP